MIGEDFDWSLKYRPKKVADVILPEHIKSVVKRDVENGMVDQSYLFVGKPGVGKTTLAIALCEELGIDYMVIPASLAGNIDTLRVDIQNFASTVSFTGGRKMVILDEADYLNPQSTQPALRNFMDIYGKNCGFIFTCNYPQRIIEPIRDGGRVARFDFKISKAEMPKLAVAMMKSIMGILEKEGIEYDKATVAAVIQKNLPNWRKCINELQKYSKVRGKIDAGILVNTNEENLKELVGLLKARKWDDMRKWVGENSDMDQNEVMRSIYDSIGQYVKKESLPAIILILSKYQYQAAFAADAEINLVACLTEVMLEAEFA